MAIQAAWQQSEHFDHSPSHVLLLALGANSSAPLIPLFFNDYDGDCPLL